MATRPRLAQWLSRKRGDGIENARRPGRWLSLLAFALCFLIGCVGVLVNVKCVLIAIPEIAVGWPIAERNALIARLRTWPILSQYIDWDRVERDSVE